MALKQIQSTIIARKIAMENTTIPSSVATYLRFNASRNEMNNGNPDLVTAIIAVNKATCWVALICIIVGLLGNATVIFVYSRAKKLAVYKILIVHLAFTDVLYCFAHIFWTHRRFMKHEWIFGYVMCKLTILWPSAMSCSMFTITMIAVERYRSIIYPFSRKWKTSRVVTALLGCWFLSFGIQVPFGVRKVLAKPYKKVDCLVRFDEDEQNLKRSFSLAGFVITYPIPLLIISFCYLHIGWQAINGFRFPGSINDHNASPHDGQRMEINDGSNKRERKYNKLLLMLALVVIAFVLTTTPNQAMILWLNFKNKSTATLDELRWRFLILHLLSSLVHFHACINPIIYCISDRKFRVEFKMLILSIRQYIDRSRYRQHSLLTKKRSHSTRATGFLSSRKKHSPSFNRGVKNDLSGNNETQL